MISMQNEARSPGVSSKKGTIALMGSGELTATMVEVHKELLAGVAGPPQAVFLDTPAGFQLNVDQLSQRAVEYFRTRVQQSMAVASYKSNETTTPFEAEQAFQTLREASFVLIGPGSPSYAVHQWKQTPIPEILLGDIQNGGCLVAASAAALTVGAFTLPVYEIYKVGQDLHWVEGMDILKHFGFNLVVVPHWNNAEGGTHDTRFCYMGEPRFRKLESLLPEDVGILGLDEHTACLIDLQSDMARIKGIGQVILRRRGEEVIFHKGETLPLEILRGGQVSKGWTPSSPEPVSVESSSEDEVVPFWNQIHAIEASFHRGLENNQPKEATNALLELDRTIWKAQKDLENEEFISQARDILRDAIVFLGVKLSSSTGDRLTVLGPLVEGLLEMREGFRKNKQWKDADAVRESLKRVHVAVEDTAEGPQWRLERNEEK
jgi:peptidase E